MAEPAGLDAQSLRDMIKWAKTRLYFGSDDFEKLAAFAGEVERLVGCVAEAERQRDYYGAALARLGELNPQFASEGKGAWQVRAERAEAALADARDALDEIAHLGERSKVWSPSHGYEAAQELAREVLGRLDQESQR